MTDRLCTPEKSPDPSPPFFSAFSADLYRPDNGFEKPPWEGFAERPSPDEAAYPIFVCALEDYAVPGSLISVPDGREGLKSDLTQDMELAKSLWEYSLISIG